LTATKKSSEKNIGEPETKISPKGMGKEK